MLQIFLTSSETIRIARTNLKVAVELIRKRLSTWRTAHKPYDDRCSDRSTVLPLRRIIQSRESLKICDSNDNGNTNCPNICQSHSSSTCSKTTTHTAIAKRQQKQSPSDSRSRWPVGCKRQSQSPVGRQKQSQFSWSLSETVSKWKASISKEAVW